MAATGEAPPMSPDAAHRRPTPPFCQLPSCPTPTTIALRHDVVVVLVDTHRRQAPRRAIHATHHADDDEHNSDPSRPHASSFAHPLRRRRTRPSGHRFLPAPVSTAIYAAVAACAIIVAAYTPPTIRLHLLPSTQSRCRQQHLHRPLRRPSTIVSACTARCAAHRRSSPPALPLSSASASARRRPKPLPLPPSAPSPAPRCRRSPVAARVDRHLSRSLTPSTQDQQSRSFYPSRQRSGGP
ncbi:hypothetical protein ACLOJK_037383 [Asimina triloba]